MKLSFIVHLLFLFIGCSTTSRMPSSDLDTSEAYKFLIYNTSETKDLGTHITDFHMFSHVQLAQDIERQFKREKLVLPENINCIEILSKMIEAKRETFEKRGFGKVKMLVYFSRDKSKSAHSLDMKRIEIQGVRAEALTFENENIACDHQEAIRFARRHLETGGQKKTGTTEQNEEGAENQVTQ